MVSEDEGTESKPQLKVPVEPTRAEHNGTAMEVSQRNSLLMTASNVGGSRKEKTERKKSRLY